MAGVNLKGTGDVRASESIVSERVSMKLNIGLDPSGVVKTASVNLGTLDASMFDGQKVINIVSALERCFTKPLYQTQHTRVTTLG